jgi:hypothetical protein
MRKLALVDDFHDLLVFIEPDGANIFTVDVHKNTSRVLGFRHKKVSGVRDYGLGLGARSMGLKNFRIRISDFKAGIRGSEF